MNPMELLGVLQPIVGKLLAFIPDPEQKAKAQQELLDSLLGAATAQNDQQAATNTAEASNASLFVAGWRPAIGWVCAAALAYQYLGRPVVSFGLFWSTGQHADMPGLDGNLWELMFAMLGIGGLRTLEKFGGVQTIGLMKGTSK